MQWECDPAAHTKFGGLWAAFSRILRAECDGGTNVDYIERPPTQPLVNVKNGFLCTGYSFLPFKMFVSTVVLSNDHSILIELMY